jgi:(1->4)-alpha-D-glucan 1-alpha-D-glucosylmutase
MAIDSSVMQVWDSIQAELARLRQIPTATYRLQFNRTFTFKDATALIPYFKALGISHLYASPYFRARAESMHGYDICDHNSLNPSIGSEQEYQEFVQTLHEHGMGQILDTVPNHMGIAEATNEYWMDVLENGPSSPYATFFDIDWQPLKQEMANQVLLPILGAQYGQTLENQELRLSYSGGAFFLHYYETQLPLAPRTYLPILQLIHDNVQERMAGNDSLLELESIMTALSHLPPRYETDPEKIAERQREKEIIKRRDRRSVR